MNSLNHNKTKGRTTLMSLIIELANKTKVSVGREQVNLFSSNAHLSGLVADRVTASKK